MNENSPDTPSGMPEVTLRELKAFLDLPHDFDEDFKTLKNENPIIAHYLATGIDVLEPHNLEKKRAFALGALTVYMMLRHAQGTRGLEAMFNAPSTGDADDADPQPSV